EGAALPGQARPQAATAATLRPPCRRAVVERTVAQRRACHPQESRLRRRLRLRPPLRRPHAPGARPARDRPTPAATGTLAGLGPGRVSGVHYLGGVCTDSAADRRD